MLTLHIEAKNYDELRAHAMTILGIVFMQPTRVHLPPAPAVAIAVDTPHVQTDRAAEIVETAAPADLSVAKRGPGRPKKEVVADAPAPAPAPAASLTLDTVRAALQAYATGQADQTIGIVKVREVLAMFTDTKGESCQKISQIQPEDYPALLKQVTR